MASLDEADTADCLRRALAGDQSAYRQFLQAVTPVVRGIVRSRLSILDEQSIEDAVQEALLALHGKRHTWQQDQPVLPWLYAIARYKAIDTFRQYSVHSGHLPIDDMMEELEAADDEPTRDMDVATAVAMLDGRVREVVHAMGVEGVTVRETSSRLGISDNAVRVAFHRGLSQLVKLRQRLTGE